MDPTAAWDELRKALAAGDRETARETASNLLDWLSRGGFPPVGTTRAELFPYLARVIETRGRTH